MRYFNLTPKQFCDETVACRDGRAFALTQPTMADVWDNCLCVDWLLWILEKIDRSPDDRTLRMFAIWCARNTPMSDGRKTGDLITDPRSLAALEVAERYANGNATDGELAAAWAAAWVAAGAAEGDAAGATAWASAWAAAGAAARAATWAAARAAACDTARAAQADQLRKMIPNPFAQGGQQMSTQFYAGTPEYPKVSSGLLVASSNNFTEQPPSITFNISNLAVLRITPEGRMIIGEGLSTEEATQKAAKAFIVSFEGEIQKMVDARIKAMEASK